MTSEPALRPQPRRPLWFAVLSFVLCWVAFGGFGTAWWALAVASRLDVRVTFAACGLGYGVFAMGSAYGLWYMKPWVPTALALWGLCGAGGLWLPYVLGFNMAPLWPPLVGMIIIGSLVGLIIRLVRRRLRGAFARS